jgi:hypothetical protein
MKDSENKTVKEVVIDGYKYLDMDGILIPIVDENFEHVKAEDQH